ncbi:hypothetical protein DFH09DRAFT_84188 [Mycena vulgaris]|nr:hypothetical protein DFH09DRAFT_84188 [Mycena vulgaris]
MYEPGPNDIKILTLAVLVLVVMRAVHPEVLLLPAAGPEQWTSAIVSFLRQHVNAVQEKAGTITPQVAVIVREIKHKNILSLLNISGAWKFSQKEAEVFAKQLAKCVDDNLM